MNLKREAPEDEMPCSSSSKKCRKSISLGTKLKVLRHFEAGERAVDIAAVLGLPPTTVRTIRSNADKIRESAQQCLSPLGVTRICRSRSGLMENMECLLALWIEEQVQVGVSPNMAAVQSKAMSLWGSLKDSQSDGSLDESFTASRGWYDRFKKRFRLYNSEIEHHVTPVMTREVAQFSDILRNIVEEGMYSPQQVFTIIEIPLYWKSLPERCVVSKSATCVSKDKLSLLLGGNACGELKMKPLTMYHLESPQALHGFSKEHLPVIWRHSKKPCLTESLFSEWLVLYAVPAWKDYCAKECLPFKILLVVGNSPSHSVCVEDLCDNVRVVFLPPDESPLLNPMEQGVTATFKMHYLRRVFEYLVPAASGQGETSVPKLWQEYNILNCLDNISESWTDVSQACLNGAWSHLWPECVQYVDFQDDAAALKKDILGLARRAGFGQVRETDIANFLVQDERELTSDEFKQVREMQASRDGDAERASHRTLTAKNLSEAFRMIEDGLSVFSENDPNRERSRRVLKHVDEVIKCYRDIYQQKRKKDEYFSEVFSQLGADKRDRLQTRQLESSGTLEQDGTQGRDVGKCSAVKHENL